MHSLYWLVRLSLKAGSHAYALEQSNIASTSQALQLENRNISNRDCDSISINRTAFTLLYFTFSHLADAFIQSDLQIRKSNQN